MDEAVRKRCKSAVTSRKRVHLNTHSIRVDIILQSTILGTPASGQDALACLPTRKSGKVSAEIVFTVPSDMIGRNKYPDFG